MERSGAPGIGHTMRPGSEGAPESTLATEPGSTHLPLLQSLLAFYTISLGFRFASPQVIIPARFLREIFAPAMFDELPES